MVAMGYPPGAARFAKRSRYERCGPSHYIQKKQSNPVVFNTETQRKDDFPFCMFTYDFPFHKQHFHQMGESLSGDPKR